MKPTIISRVYLRSDGVIQIKKAGERKIEIKPMAKTISEALRPFLRLKKTEWILQDSSGS